MLRRSAPEVIREMTSDSAKTVHMLLMVAGPVGQQRLAAELRDLDSRARRP